MSEFLEHLRKDVRLCRSDSLYLLFVLIVTVMAFVMSFVSTSSYVSQWPSLLTTEAELLERQRSNLNAYWLMISNSLLIVFVLISSMTITAEKESGMVRYVLTHRTRSWSMYLSKYLILACLAIYAVAVSSLAYYLVFTVMDLALLNAGDIFSAMVLPMMVVLTFCAIGLMVSALVNKKGAAIALGVVLFLGISMSFTMVVSMANEAAYDHPDWEWGLDEIDYMPGYFKALIKMNPMVLISGTEFLAEGEGALIGLGMIAVYLALGMIFFARERTEFGLLKDLQLRFRGRDR
ncbi:MAG: ABC-2 family transporter protein [Methanomassiliicoccales archaeon PtaB.Bin134]|jgi:ABC-type transport system involved in multi-copper enzyme maturation permease subunit|nr:MAG: ABC-2 family transporter protein [Methanomassiliicoccales archaeon PtaB.Bin134]